MRSIKKLAMHVCVRYYGALLWRKRCVRHRLASFVCCYKSMPAVRCYSGSRDQVKIDQKREYISQWKCGLFQFTDDVVALAVSQCAGALLSRTLYVLALKSLPKLLSFLR